ncbi:hypothetical protein BN1221_03777 [Brenneria goodwinii]|uniref:Uncharacterized protein n=1 Tax=Brenneria goodwinii TaxID=1109412 RepID=A0A0G4JZJ2_9GAMM|nr:hypothetical protein BN1221_03777 [Brenneria goodwinii]
MFFYARLPAFTYGRLTSPPGQRLFLSLFYLFNHCGIGFAYLDN